MNAFIGAKLLYKSHALPEYKPFKIHDARFRGLCTAFRQPARARSRHDLAVISA